MKEGKDKGGQVKHEVQEKFMQFQMMQQQMQQVQKQLQALDAQAGEMDLVQQAIEDFSGAQKNSELFVTLTPGIFVKAKLEKTDSVLLNVGGGAVVEKTIPDAKRILADQTVELRKLQGELAEQLEKLGVEAQKAQEELRKLIT